MMNQSSSTHKRILCCFGTRPEAIKMAPLIAELRAQPDISVRICVTAQHREMLDSVLSTFSIQPDFDLNLMSPNQPLPDLTCKVIQDMTPILQSEKPDLVLVQGDTTTTFAVSLAAFYQQLNVAHIEAGLRTYAAHSPFPEETNRRLTSHLASWHFAPTEQAKNNLISEGISPDHITVTGNTVIDALLTMVSKMDTDDALRLHTENQLSAKGYTTISQNRPMMLVTGHRRENFGQGLDTICQALGTLADLYPDWDIVYPVHLNPNVQPHVHQALNTHSNIFLLPHLDYLPFIYLMQRAAFILTDSGGIQEEAPSLGKPVLILRDLTERPETLNEKSAILVGTDQSKIIQEASKLIEDQAHYTSMSKTRHIYGDGNASKRIADVLVNTKIVIS